MCGIAGLIASRGTDADTIRAMVGPIAHRGPDDQGIWLDPASGTALGHRRLAIVDLSDSGHQPMHSDDGRWVLAYNGEIYNHRELRAQVEREGGAPQVGWRGHSDTETLLQAVAIWGLKESLRRAVGMFAIALWDRLERQLLLARDRFGEKPLYYGWVGGDFVFGSELKALRAHPRFDNNVDRESLRLMTARNYVPAPRSIYERIYKLEPAQILTVPLAGAFTPVRPEETSRPGGLTSRPYWSYASSLVEGMRDPYATEEDALEALDLALGASIRGQSMADVPVGAFLSGGIDSSAVVALYQRHSASSIRTYSIGFEEAGFNEAVYAKAVAAHFGTQHHERYVTVGETQDVIPRLPAMYDEPFADSSQIPTHLVSRFAREEVTVALTGDGGDELFGGYDRYFAIPRFLQGVGRVPAPLRGMAGAVLERVPPRAWAVGLKMLGRGSGSGEMGFKLQRSARRLGRARDTSEIYTSFLEEWWGEPSPVLGASGFGADCAFRTDFGQAAPPELNLMYCDVMAYLTDDILCKVDRASMAVSLETRVPFLDHRVAEVAARIPLSMKMRNGKGKHILRQLLFRYAPAQLFDRPKAGFGVPVGQWLRGPLRPWAEDLLSAERLTREGYFDVEQVRRRWTQHQSGERDATSALWSILMFQAWNAEQQTSSASGQRPVVSRAVA